MTSATTYRPRLSVHSSREELGRAAAGAAARHLRSAIAERGAATLMLAAAPSQEATLAALADQEGIEWERVVAFHMDDYVGLPSDAPQGFGAWLEQRFVSHAGALTFHRLEVDQDPQQAAERYAARLPDGPFDLVLLGLGVNGHLAFNDPPARFDDNQAVRVVELDVVSRQQQVDEGHFPTITAVPARAVTVTIPRLLWSRHVIASVPGAEKRQAVRDTLTTPVDPWRPGTALWTHPDVEIHVDTGSVP